MTSISKVHQLVEHQAAIHGDNIAVRLGSDYVTYDCLNVQANQLAHYLVQSGVRPDDIVPVIAEKSLILHIARLAILKVGAIFVPINQDMPIKTIEAIITDTSASHLLLPTSLRPLFNQSTNQLIELDHLATLTAKQPTHNLELNSLGYDVAYIIYTSGTTGKPKGVLVSHNNLLQTYYSWENKYQLVSTDRHLQLANLGFDVEIGDFVRALCSGAELVLCPQNMLLQPEDLIELIKQENITCVEFVPAVLRQIMVVLQKRHFKLSSLRLLVCGSDQWTMGEYRAVKKGTASNTRVINSYGLTEATIDSSYFEEDEHARLLPDSDLVPIGKSKSFPHCDVRILNEHLSAVPEGEVGEICIGGFGVALGYFNLPEMTAERFCTDPFSQDPHAKLYRTGDQGRLLPDGNIAFLGRNQMHIKIDGHRIDLLSLEGVLSQHPKIQHAVVVPETSSDHQVSLYGVLVTSDESLSYEDVRNYLKHHTSYYYAINAFFITDKLSLTVNGKVDRPTSLKKAFKQLIPIKKLPMNDVDFQLLAIWEEILGHNEMDMDSHFNEVGGSSLSFLTMLENVNQIFGVALTYGCGLVTLNHLSQRILQIREAQQEEVKLKDPIHRIAVVGGGPAGISLCLQLVKELKVHSVPGMLEITVFEKNNDLGHGLPYAMNEDAYILNLPKNVMEPIFGDMGNFSTWMSTQPLHWQQSAFPPRYYFGLYLNELAQKLQLEATLLGITIDYRIGNEVRSVQKKSNEQFRIENTLAHYDADTVVLCTGHMPSTTYSQLRGKEGYWLDAYQNDPFEKIESQESVGIIGTRLSAIDIVCRLMANKHQGKITMFSRGGLLPTVLANDVPAYTLRHLTWSNLNPLTQPGSDVLKLDDLLTLFWKEMSEAEQKPCHMESIIKSDKDITPLSWLNHEIKQAEKGSNPWQQVLFAIYPMVPEIWRRLNNQDKQRFLKEYYSLYMTYLAAFPLDNAYKIRDYLKSGQVEIYGGLQNIDYHQGQFRMQLRDHETKFSSHLFNATGYGYDPLSIPLYQAMINQGLLTPHDFGGIEVDAQTLQAINNQNRKHSGLYALGELTRGTALATADMTRVACQASIVAEKIRKNLVTKRMMTQKSSSLEHPLYS